MSAARTIAIEPPARLSRRVDPTAVAALFGLTVARLVRGRRLLVLSLLFALPIGIALLAQRYDPEFKPKEDGVVLIFVLIPQTLLPLTALVYASGMIRDEIEEQTLTYLLIRPLPRPAIYLVKLAGTLAVAGAIASLFTAITYAVVYRTAPSEDWAGLPGDVAMTVAAMLLALAAYGALFGLLSLFTRRSLVVGVGYIILFEGVLANIDFVIRKFTIMYQFRAMTVRWLDLNPKTWNIDLTTAPSATWAALSLAIAAVVLAGLGAWTFSSREFRVKTPEGT